MHSIKSSMDVNFLNFDPCSKNLFKALKCASQFGFSMFFTKPVCIHTFFLIREIKKFSSLKNNRIQKFKSMKYLICCEFHISIYLILLLPRDNKFSLLSHDSYFFLITGFWAKLLLKTSYNLILNSQKLCFPKKIDLLGNE